MEECLRVLTEQPEWEGDRVLAIQVRCARVTEQLTSVLIQQSLSAEPQTPVYFIKALDAQLQDIWRTLEGPASISNHGVYLSNLVVVVVTS